MRAQVRAILRAFVAAAGVLAALPAHASLFTGDTLDAVANGLAWFVLIVMPFVAIAAFLIVHVLPEKIAEKRHHPQKHAIKVLCILSLFFGGMLWPLAWLWAYTRPIAHRAIYGTEVHDDYYIEQGEKVRTGELPPEEVARLQEELEMMKSKGVLTPELKRLLDDINAIMARRAHGQRELEAETAGGGNA
jgi:CBS domain containing-hemolysin-like protein